MGGRRGEPKSLRCVGGWWLSEEEGDVLRWSKSEKVGQSTEWQWQSRGAVPDALSLRPTCPTRKLADRAGHYSETKRTQPSFDFGSGER